MRVAAFSYHHGCSLYIDNMYVCETDRWIKPDEDEFDFPKLISFLKEQGVTHVIDEEGFPDTNHNATGEWDPQPHTLQEYEESWIKD
jgi:sugar phosphate isomerase/epimerase